MLTATTGFKAGDTFSHILPPNTSSCVQQDHHLCPFLVSESSNVHFLSGTDHDSRKSSSDATPSSARTFEYPSIPPSVHPSIHPGLYLQLIWSERRTLHKYTVSYQVNNDTHPCMNTYKWFKVAWLSVKPWDEVRGKLKCPQKRCWAPHRNAGFEEKKWAPQRV